MEKPLTDQEAASLAGPRHLKVPGSLTWCWQTLSALQSLWRAAKLDFAQYEEILQEADTHEIWMKIPPDAPFGSREKMLEMVGVEEELQARARVAAQAIPAIALNRVGEARKKGESTGQRTGQGYSRSDYLIARIAKDRPDIWERMKNGEFSSVAAAAREAGILIRNPKRVVLSDNVDVVAGALKQHYTATQLRDLVEALRSEQAEASE